MLAYKGADSLHTYYSPFIIITFTSVDTTATAALSQVLDTTTSTPSLSILDLATKGGWIMIVLALLSLFAIYLFVTKYLQIRAAGKVDKYFVERIKDYVLEGKTPSALKLCDDTNTPYARMIRKGLTRIGRPMSDVLVIRRKRREHRDRTPRKGASSPSDHRCWCSDDWLPWYRHWDGACLLRYG